ncbi:MAG: DUF4910 domain-containing protein, partial [Nitrospinales bacterium]
MSFRPLSKPELEKFGEEMYDLLRELFPICRSITGNGVRKTLKVLQERLPINITEVPSGTQVFDWTVPNEWNISDAYILDPDGKKIVDFQESNLHVLGYSEPVDAKVHLDELKKHLHSLPDMPDAIPYLTSYYKRQWGFCLKHRDLASLKDGTYTVKIDSTLKPGSLTIGECLLPGKQENEILLSCYTCHPSSANDCLSGMALAAMLGKLLSRVERRFTYRIIFIPETIGAITYLSLNKERMMSKTHAGLVLSFVGDSGPFRYKKSRRGDAEIDRAVEHVMSSRLKKFRTVDFYPHLGSDERQYCSPGFDLPVGLLTRTPYLEYPEYHTSLDNLSFVSGKNLAESLSLVYEIISALEMNRSYINQVMFCEPKLSQRNLCSTLGSQKVFDAERANFQWILNYSDGNHDLLDIAEKIPMPIV